MSSPETHSRRSSCCLEDRVGRVPVIQRCNRRCCWFPKLGSGRQIRLRCFHLHRHRLSYHHPNRLHLNYYRPLVPRRSNSPRQLRTFHRSKKRRRCCQLFLPNCQCQRSNLARCHYIPAECQGKWQRKKRSSEKRPTQGLRGDYQAAREVPWGFTFEDEWGQISFREIRRDIYSHNNGD